MQHHKPKNGIADHADRFMLFEPVESAVSGEQVVDSDDHPANGRFGGNHSLAFDAHFFQRNWRRIGNVKRLRIGILLHPRFQSVSVLSPVDVAAEQVLRIVFRFPRQFIEIGH